MYQDQESLNPDCRECPLAKKGKGIVCKNGEGPDDAKIMVVSESPAKDRNNKVIKDILRFNDLSDDDVYYTSLIKCTPPQNYTITPADIKACKPYLDEEINQWEPEYVVTAGVTPTKTLFRGKAKINAVHGEFIENEKVDYIGMPVFDGGYTLRDPSKLPGLQHDLKRLSEAFYGEVADSTVVWNIVRRGNYRQFIKEFEECDEFSFDLETSGLFMHDPDRYVTAINITMDHCAWVIPVDMHPDFAKYGVGPWRRGKALRKLIRLLVYIANRDEKECYAHNGKFDNKWLMRMYGVKFNLDFDTMLAHHILDENNNHDLTTLCRAYLNEPEYDIPLNEKIGKSKKPMRNFKYCAKDGAYTFRLARIFKKLLTEDPLVERLFYRLTMPAARAMEDIELTGLTVDVPEMANVEQDLREHKIQLEKKLNKLAGREVNWNSPPQVAKVLYEDFNLPCTIRTPKGSPSTSEEAVLDLMGTHKIADMLISYRKIVKNITTYIEGFRKFMIGDTLYIDYKLHGTVTGRFSSRIHSIPKDGTIRNLITAPDGWEFVQGDLSQAELRIVAHLSGDLEMREIFLNDKDMHFKTLINEILSGGQGEYVELVIETASALEETFNPVFEDIHEAGAILLKHGPDAAIEISKEWGVGRRNAKAINFGFIYGMYPPRFVQTAKKDYGWVLTLAEAELSKKNYFGLYRGIPTWHERTKKLAKIDGSVRTLAGRLRRLPGIWSTDRSVSSEAERQAVNSPVQGIIGDIKSMAMVEIHETLPHDKLKVVGEHHDAVLMIVRTDAKAEVLPDVARIIKRPSLMDEFNIELDIPMDTDLEVGNWGLGKVYPI